MPAIALVVSTRAVSADGTGAIVTTPGVDTTGATLLVVVVTDWPNTGPSGIADSKGNTWHALTSQTTTSRNRILYAWDHGGSALSVGSGHTVSTTSGNFQTINFLAFSGTRTSSDPLGQQNGTTANASSVSPGSITPATNGEVVIAGLGGDGSNTLSINSGFTITDQDPFVGGAHFGGAAAYFVQSTAAAINPAWSASGAFNAAVTIASFKAPAPPSSVVARRSEVGTRAGSRQVIS